jgi:hypothetical protein
MYFFAEILRNTGSIESDQRAGVMAFSDHFAP